MAARNVLGGKRRPRKKPAKRKGVKVSLKIKGSPAQVRKAAKKLMGDPDAAVAQ